jgi:acyl-coenzyme A thioesterase PaaI-like protein
MDIRTHLEVNHKLLGIPLKVETGVMARVKLVASDEMKVDSKGLVHGGFTFGLADYASMLAINEPYVVLGASEVKFTSPVVVGDTILVDANVIGTNGKQRIVDINVTVEGKTVLQGKMTCYVLSEHVLDK